MVHPSLSEGLDNNAPFGNSLLEGIFKVYKQKELLEDAIIIYRTQRAPERRVFYVDVGNMPLLATAVPERVKRKSQRRISKLVEVHPIHTHSAYNHYSQMKTTSSQTAEGRTLKLKH